jgi:hypothetical protein
MKKIFFSILGKGLQGLSEENYSTNLLLIYGKRFTLTRQGNPWL